MAFISAVIVAGGQGLRLGAERPKQFLHLAGKEILQYSVDAFQDHVLIDEVVLVLPESNVETAHRYYPTCRITQGGATRQDSVKAGVDICSNQSEYILIHDAARPLVSRKIIDACIDALEEYDGTAPVLRSADSLIQIENDDFKRLDREKVRQVQTPQGFKAEMIRHALSLGNRETDEIGLIKRVFPDARIEFVAGNRRNFKVTDPDDLLILEGFLGDGSN